MILAIDLSKISSFFLGMVAGATLVFIVVLLLISKGKKEKRAIGARIEDIEKDKLDKMIKDKQALMVSKVEEENISPTKATMNVALELVSEIAKYYYPDSKYPELELNISEAAGLIHYVVNQMEALFDKPVLRPFRKVKISFIKGALDKSKEIKNNKLVKTAKAIDEAGAGEVVQAAKIVKNTLNPIYWFRKVVIKGTLQSAIKSVCKTGLSIVGNQASKVYSKKALDSTDEEQNVDISDFEEIVGE